MDFRSRAKWTLWVSIGLLAACSPPPVSDLVIRAERVLVGDGTVLDRSTVAVEGGRIVAVEGADSKRRGRIELKAETLLPGLIDSHVHLMAMHSRSSESLSSFIEGELPGLLRSYLEQGITTVRSTGDPWPAIAELRNDVNGGAIEGPRLVISGPVLTAPEGHPAVTICGGVEWCREHLTRELADEDAARAAVRELAEGGVDAIKVVSDDVLGALTDATVLEVIIDEAKAFGLPTIVHAPRSELARAALEAGAHGLVHPTDEAIEGHPVSTILGESAPADGRGSSPFPFSPEQIQARLNRRGSILAAIKAMWDAGVPVAFGTDTPWVRPDRAWSDETSLLIEAGLTPADLIVAATRNAAVALGLEDEIGTVEKGGWQICS